MFRSASLFLLFLMSALSALPGGVAMGASGEPAEDSAQSNAPSVSFLDEQPLSLKAESLLGKELEVEIHNDLGRDQKITLWVIGPEGSEGEAVKTLFYQREKFTPAEQLAPRGGTVVLKLPVSSSLPETEVTSFKAELVASGESGGLARRELTVSWEKPKPDETSEIGADEDSVANVLDPAQAVEVTLVAINFLPTPLANATSFGFFLILLLCLAIAAFHRQLRSLHIRLPLLLAAVAVLIGVVITVFLISRGDWDQPSMHAISSRPIPVASELNGVTVGAAASESGKLAQIEIADKEMRPQGLQGAGSFKGSYDFTPGVEGGNAVANIKVRDFWLYAILAIVAGLLVAYGLQRWYRQIRPQWKVGLRLERIWDQYRRRDREFRKGSENAPYKDLSFDRRFEQLRQKLDESDAAEASKLLDAMTVDLSKYYRLWKALLRLDLASAELKEWSEKHRADLEVEDLDAYASAQRLLERAAGATDPEQDAETLATVLKQVEDQDALVREILRTLEGVLRHLEVTRSLLSEPGDCETELKVLESKFVKLGVRTLQAENLEKIEEDDDEAAAELLLLSVKVKDQSGSDRDLMKIDDRKLLRGVWRGEVRNADTHFVAELADSPEPLSAANAEIRWTRRGGDAEETKAYKEDDLEFTITLPPSSELEVDKLEIEFGPGEVREVSVADAPGARSIQVEHFYATGGDRTVTVSSLPANEVLGSEPIEVAEETRTEDRERRLTEYDRVVAVTAFTLAVASGMTVLYLNKASWGEPIDYLSALVWGGISGAGVKLAAGIADRVPPGS